MQAMKKIAVEEKAKKLGREAFHARKKSVPIHDKKFMELYKEVCGEVGTGIYIFSAWLRGWNEENRKA